MVRLPGARHYYGDAGGCPVFSFPVAGDTFPVGAGRGCVPGLEDYSLSSLCGALGVTWSVEALLPARRWHDALYDALASLLIVRSLAKELNLSGQPLEVLGKAVRT